MKTRTGIGRWNDALSILRLRKRGIYVAVLLAVLLLASQRAAAQCSWYLTVRRGGAVVGKGSATTAAGAAPVVVNMGGIRAVSVECDLVGLDTCGDCSVGTPSKRYKLTTSSAGFLPGDELSLGVIIGAYELICECDAAAGYTVDGCCPGVMYAAHGPVQLIRKHFVETENGSTGDCNGNGIDDLVDIAMGTSLDCDGNDRPDECQSDCDENGLADTCDISAGAPDCDGDWILDSCQLAFGLDQDCNTNSVLDNCDITAGVLWDVNDNGVGDECEDMCSYAGDGFETYANGGALHGQGGWKGWDDDPALTAYVTRDQSFGWYQSAEVSANANIVHEYCTSSSGLWSFSIWQYIPSGFFTPGFPPFAGAYLDLLNTYTDGGPYNWSVHLQFESQSGLLKVFRGNGPNTANTPYATDRWVKIQVLIDLDNDWTQVYYDGSLVPSAEYSWTGGAFGDGGGALNVEAVALVANGSTAVYWDDLLLEYMGGSCGGNADTDLAAFALFQTCFTGAGGGPLDPGCVCQDFDADRDVDMNDFNTFMTTFAGPQP